MLNIAPSEKLIIEQARKRKQPIPETIAKAPTLYEGLDLYYDAFTELTSCRQIGNAQGPIPWTAINDYCLRYEITGTEAFSYFTAMIRALDEAYLNHIAKSKSLSEEKESSEND